MSHFGNIGHHLIVAIIDHIPNGIQWLGDVQWGHLMTHVLPIKMVMDGNDLLLDMQNVFV